MSCKTANCSFFCMWNHTTGILKTANPVNVLFLFQKMHYARIRIRITKKRISKRSVKNMSEIRNEIKSYIVRKGMTMNDVVALLADEYGWSTSVSNLSDKLRRGSLRYREAVELADVLGYDVVWQIRR